MRFVRISQVELEALRQLHESVMSYACHGLFYHEGMSIGATIVEQAMRQGPPSQFLAACREILVERGWVEDVRFEDRRILARGSVEGSPGTNAPTCHRLRGILARVYETQAKRKVKVNEVQCVSAGAAECVFQGEE